jgi:hypothetical protein
MHQRHAQERCVRAGVPNMVCEFCADNCCLNGNCLPDEPRVSCHPAILAFPAMKFCGVCDGYHWCTRVPRTSPISHPDHKDFTREHTIALFKPEYEKTALGRLPRDYDELERCFPCEDGKIGAVIHYLLKGRCRLPRMGEAKGTDLRCARCIEIGMNETVAQRRHVKGDYNVRQAAEEVATNPQYKIFLRVIRPSAVELRARIERWIGTWRTPDRCTRRDLEMRGPTNVTFEQVCHP